MMTNTTPNNEIIELYHDLLTGNVSDAMEQLNMPRAVISDLRLLGPTQSRVVGTAVTIRQARKRPGTPKTEKLVRHMEVSHGIAGKGDIVVIETGRIRDVGNWGERHSIQCQRNGILAMITDGATRDAAEIDELKFPVFCGGFSPIKSLWDLETVSINEPISLLGVPVYPGDIVVADLSGVVIIERSRADEVAILAREIRDAELAYFATLKTR